MVLFCELLSFYWSKTKIGYHTRTTAPQRWACLNEQIQTFSSFSFLFLCFLDLAKSFFFFLFSDRLHFLCPPLPRCVSLSQSLPWFVLPLIRFSLSTHWTVCVSFSPLSSVGLYWQKSRSSPKRGPPLLLLDARARTHTGLASPVLSLSRLWSACECYDILSSSCSASASAARSDYSGLCFEMSARLMIAHQCGKHRFLCRAAVQREGLRGLYLCVCVFPHVPVSESLLKRQNLLMHNH